ncbi:MAG: CBS domain-containing protein [Bacteroidetes bacterium]|nr:CBS domain-containing protein [Bacteroidota bacterium]
MPKATSVKTIMTAELVVANKFHNFSQVVRLFSEYPIHHLPVVSGNNKLEGIISSNDIIKIFKNPNLQGKSLDLDTLDNAINLGDLMTANPVTINENESIEQAAQIFRGRKFQALPVVNNEGELTGIVSLKDVLEFYATVMA